MPKVEDQFQTTPLKWDVLQGGAQYTTGDLTGIDLDGLKAVTGQAYSQIFTIGAVPEGAEDDKWDTVEFGLIYQHVNWAAKSKLSDHGTLVSWIADENQKIVESIQAHHQFLGRENAPAGRAVGSFTASFDNLAPGKYRLFVGETDKGDGEPLRLQIYEGKAIENVPEPPPPSAPVEETTSTNSPENATVEEEILSSDERDLNQLGEPPSTNGGEPASEEEILSRGKRDLDQLGEPPLTNGGESASEEEILSRGKRDLDQLGEPPPTNGGESASEEEILSRGKRDLDQLGEPPPTNGGESASEEEILSRGKRDLDQLGEPPPTNGGESASEEEVLSRGKRDLDRLGEPPPTNGGESWFLEPRILSRGERDLSRFGPPPPTNGGEISNGAPCFAAGTMIETREGPIQIEELCKGVLVKTCARGWQPIRWFGSRKLGAADLNRYPQLRPIRIKAGSLGAETPFSDLTVSPQHRILVRSKPAQRMFGTNEILVAAKHLLGIEGIDTVWDQDEVEYFHFMFARHEIVFANGAETESFYAGEQALKTVDKAAFKEISMIFPQLKDGDQMAPAAPFATGRRAKQLIRRHLKNHLDLVSCIHTGMH